MTSIAVTNGNYIPTIVNSSNVVSSSATNCNWFRVGNNVTAYGSLSIGVGNSSPPTQWRISLPIPSRLSAIGNLAGTAGSSDSVVPIVILADIVNHVALFTACFPQGGRTATIIFHFSYEVQQ